MKSVKEHVLSLCQKASQKLSTLSWIAYCLTFNQKGLISNSFITSHFSYCSIVWMFHIHEKALRIVYQGFKSSFQELLKNDNSLNIHHRNLQKLAIEIFNVKKWLITWSHKWCFRVYRKTILPTNKFAFQVQKDPYNKIMHRNTFLT